MVWLKPYYRLTKPGIIYGNLWPLLAAYLLASRWQGSLLTLAAVVAGQSLIIASACISNNIMDRSIDAKMTRTQKRALVTGEITVMQAVWLAIVTGIAGLFLLVWHTNLLTASLGLAGYFLYVFVYGWAKRNGTYGTIVGSLSGALPPVAGYTAYTNKLDITALLLFLILVAWQMPHFYAIALYRKKDYEAAELPVIPVKKSAASSRYRIIGYIILLTVTSVLLGALGPAGKVYTVAALLICLGWLAYGFSGWRLPIEKWARGMFFMSLIVLLALCLVQSLGSVLP